MRNPQSSTENPLHFLVNYSFIVVVSKWRKSSRLFTIFSDDTKHLISIFSVIPLQYVQRSIEVSCVKCNYVPLTKFKCSIKSSALGFRKFHDPQLNCDLSTLLAEGLYLVIVSLLDEQGGKQKYQ